MTKKRARATSTALGLVFVGGGLVAVAACSSSDDRPPISAGGAGGTVVGGGSSSSSSSGSSGEGGTTDGGDGGGDGGMTDPCAPFQPQGQIVGELLQPDPVPTETGGAPTPGSYDLTQWELFDPTASQPTTTGRTAQISLVVTTTTISVSQVLGGGDAGPSSSVFALSYQVDGANLKVTSICPTAGAALTYTFTATSTGIVLDRDGKHRETFQRVVR